MITVSDVAELRGLIQSKLDPAWAKKMLHVVPEWPTVKDRAAYLVERVKDRTVLDVGCTGVISTRLRSAARAYHGVDKVDGGDWFVADLDLDPTRLPAWHDVDLVVVSEFLEHLANPGFFLAALARAYAGVEMIVTVPNAGAYMTRQGCEVVNADHVAWYSYTTLTTLLRRYGYIVESCCWYNGPPHRAEGLIVHARTR